MFQNLSKIACVEINVYTNRFSVVGFIEGEREIKKCVEFCFVIFFFQTTDILITKPTS